MNVAAAAAIIFYVISTTAKKEKIKFNSASAETKNLLIKKFKNFIKFTLFVFFILFMLCSSFAHSLNLRMQEFISWLLAGFCLIFLAKVLWRS